jgi:hypothetical protein
MGGSGGEHMLEGAVASRRSAGRDCPGLRARAAGRPWAGCCAWPGMLAAACGVWWRLAGCCSVAAMLLAGWLWLWWLLAVAGCGVCAGCGRCAGCVECGRGVAHSSQNLDLFEYRCHTRFWCSFSQNESLDFSPTVSYYLYM